VLQRPVFLVGLWACLLGVWQLLVCLRLQVWRVPCQLVLRQLVFLVSCLPVLLLVGRVLSRPAQVWWQVCLNWWVCRLLCRRVLRQLVEEVSYWRVLLRLVCLGWLVERVPCLPVPWWQVCLRCQVSRLLCLEAPWWRVVSRVS